MLEEKILETIKKYNLLQEKDTVIVAVSGGPDSMCLLNSLVNLKEKLKLNKIAVAHVNHMLREEAQEETEYVKKYCENKNIEIYIRYANIKEISENNKISEETAGREERYKFFEEIATKINANKIAIAHNLNDNAETVLMHFIRGTGINGLTGIKPYRDGKYIRPLIECDRKEIEEYCKERKLNPRYDKSNLDNNYTRNKIRNLLIPELKENYNPNIISGINKLSRIVLKEEEYINKILLETYNEILLQKEDNKITINLRKFNKLDEYIKESLIIYIIAKLFGDARGIENIHVFDIVKLCEKNVGNKYLTPNKNLKIFVKSGEVSYEKLLK